MVGDSFISNEIWRLDLADSARWSQVPTPSNADGLALVGAAIDPTLDRLIMAGSSSVGVFVDAFAGVAATPLDGPVTWTNLDPAGLTPYLSAALWRDIR